MLPLLANVTNTSENRFSFMNYFTPNAQAEKWIYRLSTTQKYACYLLTRRFRLCIITSPTVLYIYQYINNVEIYIHYQGQLSPLIFNVNVQDFVKVEKPLLQNTFPTSTSPLAQNVPVTIL